MTLPAAPKSESDEGSYGGFDGTAPDMRGDTAKPLDPDAGCAHLVFSYIRVRSDLCEQESPAYVAVVTSFGIR